MKAASVVLILLTATFTPVVSWTAHASTKAHYFAEFTTCVDVNQYREATTEDGKPTARSSAVFSPLHDHLRKRLKVGAAILPEQIENTKLAVIEIEAPKHGKTIADSGDKEIRGKKKTYPIGTRLYYYEYQPEVGYLGKDRATYEISALGKKYKMTVHFIVVPFVPEDETECWRRK